MIERILYVNLDRRPDRNTWFLEHMEQAGVPMEIVESVPGKDWQDYDSVTEMLEQMYKEDGFGLRVPPKKECLSSLGLMAYIWSMCLALKQIIDSEKITLLMPDDSTIISWENLVSSLATLEISDKRLLQVINLEYAILSDYRPVFEDYLNPYNNIWCYGAGGCETGVIYTPVGADCMLSLLQGQHTMIHDLGTILLEHFNNFRSFSPAPNIQFIDFFPLSHVGHFGDVSTKEASAQ